MYCQNIGDCSCGNTVPYPRVALDVLAEHWALLVPYPGVALDVLSTLGTAHVATRCHILEWHLIYCQNIGDCSCGNMVPYPRVALDILSEHWGLLMWQHGAISKSGTWCTGRTLGTAHAISWSGTWCIVRTLGTAHVATRCHILEWHLMYCQNIGDCSCGYTVPYPRVALDVLSEHWGLLMWQHGVI
jgi:hypothetical protein